MHESDRPAAAKHIFIVEDEPMLAIDLEQLLPKLGHVVSAVAHQLRDAMRIADAGGFDMAVLDVNLAGDLSYRLADVLLARGVPFVFCTAYADVAFGRYKGIPVLHKPFDEVALARAIEEALSQAA